MKNARNILVVTLEGGGNIPPVLGLAKELAALGNTVTVLSEPCLENTVRNANLNFIAFTDYFTRKSRTEDIFRDSSPASILKPPAMEYVMFGPAKTLANQTYLALKESSADILLADCLLPPALIPAEALGIKRVILCHMPEYLPGPGRPPGILGLIPGTSFFGKMRDKLLGKVFNVILNNYLPIVNEVSQTYGLKALDATLQAMNRADLRLIQTLRLFDFPLEPAHDNVRYVGPCLDDPDWVGELPASIKDKSCPLVVISLSSTFQNQKASIQNAINGLKNLNVQGVVTLGPAMSNEKFDKPDNVILLASAPHSKLFPIADLVITHGGHGTIMRALANGLPLICMPMGRDQNDNAAKVQYHQIGLRLKPNTDSLKIEKAVQHVLGSQQFKIKAQRFQSELKKTNNLKDYLDEILA